LKFVAKNEDNQVYGKMITYNMVSKEIKESTAYKTYFAYATSLAIPKKAIKGSKVASQQKKASSVTASNDSNPEPTKKPIGRRKPTGVVIKVTPAMSKQKTTVHTQKHKGIDLLSESTLLEEAQIKNAIKESKWETRFQHQAGGSSDGASSQPKVPDGPKGKSDDTSKGASSKPEVSDVLKAMSSDQKSEYESWGDSEDDDDDHQSDDERNESNDDKSIDLNRINDEEKETKEDEFVHTPDDYIPTDDETQDSSSLLVVPISVIPKPIVIKPPEIVIAAPATTITPFTPPVIPSSQQSTPLPIPTTSTITTNAPTSTSVNLESETLSSLQLRASDLEKEVKELKQVNLLTTLHASIRSEVPPAVNEYLGSSLGDALQKELRKHIEELRQE
nr:hypothetical protein [Tanacetum cinerariifolium]